MKHWGRISGRLNETVIEVIERDTAGGTLCCASGYGAKSQWFKNITTNPNVFVTLKNIEYEAMARILTEQEATSMLVRYASAHPKAIKAVAKLSGYEMDGTESDVIEFSKVIKIIEFSLKKR